MVDKVTVVTIESLQEEVRILREENQAIKQELDYTLFNGLLFSASIRTVLDVILKTPEEQENFERALSVNLKLIEAEFKKNSNNVGANDG